MSPPRTWTFPVWIAFAPAMIPIRVDLPTPSGPISPTMHPDGISAVKASSAQAFPYRWVSPVTVAIGVLVLVLVIDIGAPGVGSVGSGLGLGLGLGLGEGMFEGLGPRHGVVEPHVAHPPDSRLDPLDIRQHDLGR